MSVTEIDGGSSRFVLRLAIAQRALRLLLVEQTGFQISNDSGQPLVHSFMSSRFAGRGIALLLVPSIRFSSCLASDRYW